MRYVYADIFFLVNLCFDFSLLYLTGRLARAPMRGRRLALGALLGATYSVASLFPDLAFLMGLPLKMLFSILMIAVAFPPSSAHPPGRALRTLGTLAGLFYVSAFVLGGAALGYAYVTLGDAAKSVSAALAGTGGDLGPGMVFPAALLGAVLLHWAVAAGRERAAIDVLEVECRVVVSGHAAEFHALVDTGNRLRDPLSDAPVVIVEYRAVGDILPPAFGPPSSPAPGKRAGAGYSEGPDDEPDLGSLVTALADSPWSARLRVVPFTSLGRASGLLIGFRPDEFVALRKGRAVRRTDVVICVSPRPLSSEGRYRALVPPEVLVSLESAGAA